MRAQQQQQREDSYGNRESEQGICGSLVQLVSQSLVWDHDNREMSGDNEETPAAEETTVDEKVTLR